MHALALSAHHFFSSALRQQKRETKSTKPLSSFTLDKPILDLRNNMKFSTLALLAATAGSAAADIYLKESFDDVSFEEAVVVT
jgi:hypothetical protein